ncbi:phosphatase PAP2 family protein [Marinactinospora thermotolerans]|uniref:Undecaprenyl-diphosphatase n=1 Tax=Marinactinospora thermotolerans DSM 45154 TaxID=1122192 RepID=A0A1T4T2U1_9ACTN|nr:phosphatase PAP2 family protein [Marinactinospora thermotolerans]SKA34756.1 undecaprenyl-diphosphatase [Marinactinospora thermotolerans DSM 45154]
MPESFVADLVGLSTDWYLAVAALAEQSPPWLRLTAEIGTEAGLALFAALFLAAWWRARARGARDMALALLAPCATVAVYLVSETVKSVLHQQRPCHVLTDVMTIAQCPPAGDWSFPSNHAAITAAAAAAVIVAWRRLAAVALPLAVLMGFSRVFVGVHYPHDVMVGFLLGVLLAPLLVLLLAPLLARLVQRLRERPLPVPLLADALGGRRALGGHRVSSAGR